jgi:hypothetical protein
MPTLNSHTITHSLSILMVFVNPKRFAKPHQPTLKPKLGKECVCPNAQQKRPKNQQTKKKHDCLTYKD